MSFRAQLTHGCLSRAFTRPQGKLGPLLNALRSCPSQTLSPVTIRESVTQSVFPRESLCSTGTETLYITSPKSGRGRGARQHLRME